MNYRTLATVALIASFAWTGPAQAETLVTSGLTAGQQQIPVKLFLPPPGGVQNYNVVHGARVLSHMNPAVGVLLNFAQNPLMVRESPTGREQRVLESRWGLDLMAALGLLDEFQIGLALPLILQQDGNVAGIAPDNSLTAQSIGDLRLVPKWRLTGPAANVGFALLATVTLPSGDESAFSTEGSPTVEPKGVLEWKLSERSRFAVNAGFRFREQQKLLNVDVGNELTFGAGMGFDATHKVTFLADLYGSIAADGDSDPNSANAPLELDLGLRFNLADGHLLTVGGGPGVTNGWASPDYRVFAGYQFSPAVAMDRDGDGLADAQDTCPDDPEDIDGYLDKDGCPDFDDDLEKAVAEKWKPEPEVVTSVVVREAPDVRVTKSQIEIFKRVLFDVDKDSLRPESYDIIGQVAHVLRIHPEITRVRIEGHTDSTASDGYNLGLSWKRSRKVVSTLNDMGVVVERMESMGYGERRPIADNLTDEGRQQNRRVVFTILERSGQPLAAGN